MTDPRKLKKLILKHVFFLSGSISTWILIRTEFSHKSPHNSLTENLLGRSYCFFCSKCKEFGRDEVAQQLANLDVGRLLQSELGAGEVAQLAKPDIWLQLQPEFEASHFAQHFATFETWRRIHSEFSGTSVPWRSARSHAWGAKLQAQFVSGCASADFKELNFWPFVQSELSFRDASGPRQPDIWRQLQLESRDRESSTKLAAPDPGRKV